MDFQKVLSGVFFGGVRPYEYQAGTYQGNDYPAGTSYTVLVLNPTDAANPWLIAKADKSIRAEVAVITRELQPGDKIDVTIAPGDRGTFRLLKIARPSKAAA